MCGRASSRRTSRTKKNTGFTIPPKNRATRSRTYPRRRSQRAWLCIAPQVGRCASRTLIRQRIGQMKSNYNYYSYAYVHRPYMNDARAPGPAAGSRTLFIWDYFRSGTTNRIFRWSSRRIYATVNTQDNVRLHGSEPCRASTCACEPSFALSEDSWTQLSKYRRASYSGPRYLIRPSR